MPATHKSITYKSGDAPNPFQKGGERAYTDLFFEAQKRARFLLFVIAPGSLLCFAISLALFNVSISRQQKIPILLNVMPSGEAAYLGEVREAGEIRVPEAAIFYQLRKFITNYRSISIDYQVLFNNIKECYSMISGSYEPIFTRVLDANNPFPLLGRVRRGVEIESILRITGDSYQVDWIETSIEGGNTPASRKMRALLTVRIIPPDPSFIKTNPLGIFIEAFEWTEL
jgi:type IV secretion system protein VirB5